MSVPNEDDGTIEKIAIQDAAHYTTAYPSSPQIELTPSSLVDDLKITDNKEVVKTLLLKDLNLLGLNDTGLLFLYIKETGSTKTDCICVKDLTVTSTMNIIPLFLATLKIVQDTKCNDPYTDTLIDIFLKKQAIIEAIYLEEFEVVIDLYNNYIYPFIQTYNCLNTGTCTNYNSINTQPTCGCNQ